MEAVLCLRHRQEIALTNPSARGSGEFGDACDLCEAGTSDHLNLNSHPCTEVSSGPLASLARPGRP